MRRLCVAIAVLFFLPAFTRPVVADTINQDCDCFTTPQPGSQVKIALPAGCTQPADGIIQLQNCGQLFPPVNCHGCANAVILQSYDKHGTNVDPDSVHKVGTSASCPPDVDTVVCRTTSASFTNVGEQHPITTQLVELSLCSVGCPIVCAGGATYRIHVTADGPQPTGTTNFKAVSITPFLSGTTTLGASPPLPAGDFPVNYKVDFQRCDQAGSLPSVTGSIDFTSHTGAFSRSTILPMSSGWQQVLLAVLLIALTAWFVMARRRRTSSEEVS